MKVCHTKLEDIIPSSGGNAITVNSPCIQVKHFFCHCAICGEGYDDYVQLSTHEGVTHNYPCELCDEFFMAECDLSTHVASKHKTSYLCDICADSFPMIEELEVHNLTVHGETVNDDSNLDVISNCGVCDENKRRVTQFDLLEKEHILLKDEHAKFKELYFKQSSEITAVREKYHEKENEVVKMKMEVDRMMRNNTKSDKDQESKLKDMKNEMQKAYNKVNDLVQENEKLKEENRTLIELRNVNELLIEKLSSGRIDVNNEDIEVLDENTENNDEEEIEDDYPNDEEVAAFFSENRKKRAKRTNPQAEADPGRNNNPQAQNEPGRANPQAEPGPRRTNSRAEAEPGRTNPQAEPGPRRTNPQA